MEYTTQDLIHMKQVEGLTYNQIVDRTGLSYEQVRKRIKRVSPSKPVALPASPLPRYDTPLRMNGDALLLFDTEFPYHHSDFLNRVLDLAHKWGIDQCAIGGDVVHFESFSAWGAAWTSPKKQVDSLSEKTESDLRALIQALPLEQQGPLIEKLNEITGDRVEDDEILQAQKSLKLLAQGFKTIHYIIGNHDDRFLRRLNSPLTPQKLLDFLGLNEPCWDIGPYYWSELISNGEKYHIEHPKGAGENEAVRLANTFECHTIVGHAHLWSKRRSQSGRYWAIMAGHCCDELRMPYAAQRHSGRIAHSLGAVIVRDGFPFDLRPDTPWKLYERM